MIPFTEVRRTVGKIGQVGHYKKDFIWTCSLQFSHSVMSDSLQPHELQYARPSCPSPTPRVGHVRFKLFGCYVSGNCQGGSRIKMNRAQR